MSAPRILAGDLSKTCSGIAEGVVGQPPVFHSVRGAGLTDAEACEGLFLLLQRLTKAHEYIAFFFEAPLNAGWSKPKIDWEKREWKSDRNPQSVVPVAKITGVFELVARLRSIPCESVNVATARKEFLGSGRPEDPKKRAMACAKALGWSPHNADEGDSACIFYYGAVHTAPRLAQVITPMQQRQAATSVMGNERPDDLDVPLSTPLRVDRNGQAHVDYRAARGMFKRRAS